MAIWSPTWQPSMVKVQPSPALKLPVGGVPVGLAGAPSAFWTIVVCVPRSRVKAVDDPAAEADACPNANAAPLMVPAITTTDPQIPTQRRNLALIPISCLLLERAPARAPGFCRSAVADPQGPRHQD